MSQFRPAILFLVTEDWYFVSHRLPLARAAITAGYRVVVATRVQAHGATIRESGCELRALSWRRSGNWPWSHLLALAELTRLYREVRPDLVHHIALKPVIFGSFAAWRAGIRPRVNALAGLGFVFSSRRARARLLRPVLRRLLAQALRGEHQRVIVQNQDDRATLIAAGLASPAQIRLIRGAGVELAEAPTESERESPPLVLLVSRMLWEKGVGEFVAAATALRARGVPGRFVLVGSPDPENPGAISPAQLEAWTKEGVVEWWGHRSDVPQVLRRASIFCLPTRYGEGIPRSLLEAGASGLALVATDAPGCREVIRSGVNGVLVAPGDREGLIAALASLLGDPGRRARLGSAARETIASEFSLERVIEETLAVYRELLP